MDDNFEDALKVANKKHDIVALKIEDEIENEISIELQHTVVQCVLGINCEFVEAKTASNLIREAAVSFQTKWRERAEQRALVALAYRCKRTTRCEHRENVSLAKIRRWEKRAIHVLKGSTHLHAYSLFIYLSNCTYIDTRIIKRA